MPGPKPPSVHWTEPEREALAQLTRAHKTAQPLVLWARCTSTQDPKRRLLACVDSFKQTMARPFKGTYGSKPLTA